MTCEDCCQLFVESYEVSGLPAMRDIERAVLGCDYGGTSWTTRRQAEQIAETLELEPGARLIDIGAGSGWPGLFLADMCGCDVTLVDLPLNALTQARKRAMKDGIDERIHAVAGSAVALPFGDDSFDAVSHSDVLCCLPEKLEMLRECRRVARDGASMSFSVIAIRQGISTDDLRRAIDAGPPFVEAPGDYDDLLAKSGWRLVERVDVTVAYSDSLKVLVRAFDESVELTDALGRDTVDEFRQRRKEQIAAVDAGLICREVFLAVAG